MKTPGTVRAAAIAAALLLAVSHAASAQVAPARGIPAGCTYEACALRLEQGWGTRLVRGVQAERVSKVGGFGTGVAILLGGPDSSRFHARKFQSASNVASTLGLISFGAFVYAAVRANKNRDDETAAIVGLAGTGVGLIAIPFNWRAQRGLSRAIWHYNAALAR